MGNYDEAAGKAKELEGELTGDDAREAEGQAQQGKGKVEEAGDKIKDAAEDVKDRVTGDDQ